MASSNTRETHVREYGEWNTISTTYQSTVGRLTTPIVTNLVNWTNDIVSLNDPHAKALDNGCGTGILCSALKKNHPDTYILATDFSPGMVEQVRENAKRHGWKNFEARVLDGRDLNGVDSGSMTHVFSSFMVCLAPEPDKIVREMHRVLAPSGVLGLAVWGKPDFGYWEGAWTGACRELDPGYEAPIMMDPEWTRAENVEKGLVKAGFSGVEVRRQSYSWKWDGVEEALGYFFEGGNPEIEKEHRSWTERGGRLEDVRPRMGRRLKEAYGKRDGSLEGPVSVSMAIARK